MLAEDEFGCLAQINTRNFPLPLGVIDAELGTGPAATPTAAGPSTLTRAEKVLADWIEFNAEDLAVTMMETDHTPATLRRKIQEARDAERWDGLS